MTGKKLSERRWGSLPSAPTTPMLSGRTSARRLPSGENQKSPPLPGGSNGVSAPLSESSANRSSNLASPGPSKTARVLKSRVCVPGTKANREGGMCRKPSNGGSRSKAVAVPGVSTVGEDEMKERRRRRFGGAGRARGGGDRREGGGRQCRGDLGRGGGCWGRWGGGRGGGGGAGGGAGQSGGQQ